MPNNKTISNKSPINTRGATKALFSLSPSALVWIIVIGAFLAALYLRIYFPYEHIFGDNGTKFIDPDSYYHMRLIESLLSNSFHRIPFDPYTYFPHGSAVTWPAFFDLLVAGIIWLIGLGSPSQNTITIVGAYIPPVLGAITVFPVYFIGKILFNRWAGAIAAVLVAIMPTELLFRSRLGDIDHHVAESLLVCVIILLLILAVKAGKDQAMKLGHIIRADWSKIGRPLLYSLLAGIVIGMYMLTWVGGLMFVFCLFLFFVILSVHDHLRGFSTDYIAIIGFTSMSIGAVIALPHLPESWLSPLLLPSFSVAALAPLTLAVISNWMNKRNIPKVYYVLALLGLGIAGAAFLLATNPDLLRSSVRQFDLIFRTGAALSISEARPLLFPQGQFSLVTVWRTYTTGSILFLIGLGVLVHSIIRQAGPAKILLLIWTLVMGVATLAQIRFGYYLAVNVALLSGYAAWSVLQWFGFNEHDSPAKMHKKSAGEYRRPFFKIRPGRMAKIISISFVSLMVIYPNITFTLDAVKSTAGIENDAWFGAFKWLKENTPDPFGNPDFYYDYYDTPPPKQNFSYPDTAYGVMAPWGKGHEITFISHRIPVANPFQHGALLQANFFASKDEASANQLMDKLGARYVMGDENMTKLGFYSTIAYGDTQSDEYFGRYYLLKDGKLTGMDFFYPEYFRSTVVRLFAFDGEQVEPQECWVISFEEKYNKDGSKYRQVTYAQNYSSYDEASAFVAKQKSGNYKIGSTDFTKSPVYLPKLDHYELVYRSGVSDSPEVKIFSYTK